MNDQDFENKIDENLEIRVSEKDEFGEVMTPSVLIHEILDNLPKKVWTEPEFKWLDPAAGSGNFFMLVYNRLMRSLVKIPMTRRREHILTKMLYMVEINPDNTKILRKLFGKEANIETRDFLDNSNSSSIFDVIIGNPPFQSTKKDKYVGAVGKKTLWDKFIVKSLNLLNNNGFLGFITPANWRRPEAELYNKMTKENHLHFLHIYSKSQGKEIFHVGTRFDVYIIQKRESSTDYAGDSSRTTIIDEMGEIDHDFDMKKWPFLPNYNYKNLGKIIQQDINSQKNNCVNVIFDSSLYDARHLSKRKTPKFHYPVVHTITNNGLGIRYADNKSPHQFGVSKVLLNFNEQQYPYNDYNGQYGMSQLTFGIPINSKSEGDRIIDAINSPAFREIIRATKWGAFQTDYRMFKYFKRDFYENPIFIKPHKHVRKFTSKYMRKHNMTKKIQIK